MTEAQVSMITLLREARGWNQTTLAEEAKLSQAVVSRIETGALEPNDERLTALAEALHSPREILMREPSVPGLTISCLHHRRRSSTLSVRTMRRIEALTHLTRLSLEGMLAGLAPEAKRELVRESPTAASDPRGAARRLRALWNLGTGPISDLVQVVESAGIFVVERDFSAAGQDAVSTWPTDESRFPMMIVSAGLAADRLRFTVAHELGHLLMHDRPGAEQEEQANAFASEFLAPADTVLAELTGLRTGDFRRLLTLKERWGMSIAALIRRAYDLDQITERQYREFNVRLGQLGWRKAEPGTVPPERPTSVAQIVKVQQQVRNLSMDQIASLAGMTEEAFRRHFLGEEPEPQQRVRLTMGAPVND